MGPSIPFGYDYDPQRQLLTPNHDEALVVRRIFKDFIALGSIARVCDELSAAGVTTRSRLISTRTGDPHQVGGRRFRPDVIKSLIQHPIYLGFIRCQGETYPGRHEPLVSPETWDEANAVLIGRVPRANPSSPRDDHIHLLKGLIHCEDCGSTMTPHPSGKTGKNGERFLYYACTAVVREPKRCSCRLRRLPVRKFEAAVIGLLAEIAGDEDVLLHLADQARHHYGEELPRLRRARTEYQSRLELMREQSTRLIAVFKTRERVPKSVVEEYERMEEETEELRIQIAELDDRIAGLESGAPDVVRLREMLQPFIGGLRGMPLAARKTVIQSVIGGIGVNRFVPSSADDGDQKRRDGLRIRTRRLVVHIALRAKTPESLDSGASGVGRVNRLGSGSDLGQIGSPRRTTGRTLSDASYSRFCSP